jgi:hypothetical protein
MILVLVLRRLPSWRIRVNDLWLPRLSRLALLLDLLLLPLEFLQKLFRSLGRLPGLRLLLIRLFLGRIIRVAVVLRVGGVIVRRRILLVHILLLLLLDVHGLLEPVRRHALRGNWTPCGRRSSFWTRLRREHNALHRRRVRRRTQHDVVEVSTVKQSRKNIPRGTRA